MKYIAYNFFSICLVGLAAYLIYLNKSGWGWVVFAAFFVSVVPSSKKEKSKKEKSKRNDNVSETTNL